MFKDDLDCRVEQLKRKLDYCRQYETNRIEKFEQESLTECDQWKTKIKDLEIKIETENQRSSNVESNMCAEIEVFINLCFFCTLKIVLDFEV